MKKYIIISVVILLSAVSVSCIYIFNENKKVDNKETFNVISNNEIKEKDIKDSSDKNEEQKEDLPNTEPEQKENNKDTKKPETKEEVKKPVINNTQTNQTPKKEEPKQDTSKKEIQNIETPKVEKKPWEELGISENDYYNKPMWSWMKIDFDVNSFGSQVATEKACRDYGNKKAEEESLGFSCTNVLSYSGKYLGEYIKFF